MPINSKIDSAVVIGAGHVSTHFCHAMHESGIEIKTIYSRNKTHAEELTNKTGGVAVDSLDMLSTEADVYLICVPDQAIGEIALHLKKYLSDQALVLHTSGQTSVGVLKSSFERSGIIYPLQSLHRDHMLSMNDVPLVTTVSENGDREVVSNFASRISEQVVEMNDEDRMKLHVPAVLVNNFVNYFYAEAWRLCQERNLPFKLFLPLIRQTAQRITEDSDPHSLQTGPAIRYDENTLLAHMEQLKHHPDLLTAYQVLTRNIQKMSK